MNTFQVYVETGKRKTFVCAVDWPGWCRSGRGEGSALQALVDYGPRYAQVLRDAEIEFRPPKAVAALAVTERLEGNATTDFGSPATIRAVDEEPFGQAEFERFQKLLSACWRAFDRAVQRATGKVLRKGPRGGGRDLEKNDLFGLLFARCPDLFNLTTKFKGGAQ